MCMGSPQLLPSPAGACGRSARVTCGAAGDAGGAVTAEPACELPTPAAQPGGPLAPAARHRSRLGTAGEVGDDRGDQQGGPPPVPAAAEGRGEGQGEHESGVGSGSGLGATGSGPVVQGPGGRKRKATAAQGGAAADYKRRPR